MSQSKTLLQLWEVACSAPDHCPSVCVVDTVSLFFSVRVKSLFPKIDMIAAYQRKGCFMFCFKIFSGNGSV